MTANYASRKFGVKAAMSARKALTLCPDLKLIPPHMELYKEYSAKVMDILLSFTKKVEKKSIDEACMDITDLVSDYNEAKILAFKIINEIKNSLNLSVSVGISFNKTMAKLGSDLAEPLKVFIITKDSLQKDIWPLPVKFLTGAGPKTCEKLYALNIQTIGDLAKTDPLLLRTMLKKQGDILYNKANGLDDTPVDYSETLPKSIGCSKTSPIDLTTVDECKEFFIPIADNVLNRLNSYQARATTICVTIRTHDFNTITRQKTLAYHINTKDTIIKEAYSLFIENWDNKTPIRLLGISLSGIEYYKEQLSFMDMF